MPPDDARLLTVESAARCLGISRGKLYPYVMSGALKSCLFGRSRRIPVAALDEFVRSRMDDSAPIFDPSGPSRRER